MLNVNPRVTLPGDGCLRFGFITHVEQIQDFQGFYYIHRILTDLLAIVIKG